MKTEMPEVADSGRSLVDCLLGPIGQRRQDPHPVPRGCWRQGTCSRGTSSATIVWPLSSPDTHPVIGVGTGRMAMAMAMAVPAAVEDPCSSITPGHTRELNLVMEVL